MNTKKILMYNGGTKSYYGCDDPKVLTKGKLYEIIAEKDLHGCQTNYTLKGIEGEFNSIWFSEPTSYFAYVSEVPLVGDTMRNFIYFEGIHPKSIKHTSTILCVEPITSNIYKVYTKNTLYIIKVLNETTLYTVKVLREES